ncbi:hypothetical protein CTAYLR_008713 [Chrysophaeum taylorii]|uniref:Uncharacterized protein n=1 Tax=Chrysophaeum taylorii TaxID=2483200 RepID=A0AAD7UJF9_9STRA|nr:hypothetical protein CTAYLR_008713 [Chrysophaeum taylorii]
MVEEDGGIALSERIQCFVPRTVLERLEEGPVEGGEMVRTEAAVGFFDISGFTKLSTELAAKEHQSHQNVMNKSRYRRSSFGTIGGADAGEAFATASLTARGLSAEVLTLQLNKMFGSVIEVIERHGGDIIKFVGDAMIVMWTAKRPPPPPPPPQEGKRTTARFVKTTDKDLDTVLLVATLCALESVAVMKRMDSKLGIHIGVAVGSVLQCIVGNPETRFETFLAGEACRATFRAMDVAKAGEIVVPTKTWERLSRIARDKMNGEASGVAVNAQFTRLEGIRLPQNDATLQSLVRPLPPMPPPTAALARLVSPFLPKPFVSALDPRLGGARSEMRSLGVLFASITGLPETQSDSTFLAAIQIVMKALVEACHKHGACLRQFVFDDKGFVAVICGGMPTSNSHSIEPSNCVVNVVAYIRGHYRKIFDAAKFGITTGKCFCGPVGALKPDDDDDGVKSVPQGRQDYAVVGDAVNLAARLMSKAAIGQVRVDELTRDSTVRDGFTYERLPDFTPKGKTVPVKNYGLILKDAHAGGPSFSTAKSIANAAIVRTLRGIASAKRGSAADCDEEVGPFANLDHFVDRGSAFDALRRLCRASKRDDAVQTLVVSGGIGSGKTTLLEVCTNCLSMVHVLTLYASCEPTDCEQQFASFRAIAAGPSSDRGSEGGDPTTNDQLPEDDDFLEEVRKRSSLQLSRLHETGYLDHKDIANIFEVFEVAGTRRRPKSPNAKQDNSEQQQQQQQQPEEFERMCESLRRLLEALIASGTEFAGDVMDVQPELVDFVLTRSSGNPYAALAIVSDLKSKEVVALDEANGLLKLSKDTRDLACEVPESVRSSVTAAFDALDSTKQAILRLASTLGARVDVGCLAFLFWRFFRCTSRTSKRFQGRSLKRPSSNVLSDGEKTPTETPRKASRSFGGALTFEVTGTVDFRDECFQLVRLNYLDFDGAHHLVFCRDLTRQVIYHQMLAADRKAVHLQIVNWHTFKLATRAKRTTVDLNQQCEADSVMPTDMAVHGEIAFHALCAEQSELAFHFCVRAFSLAIKANLVDVALGFVNDSEGISENQKIPESFQVQAQLGLMRAVVQVHQANYGAALESLEALPIDRDISRCRLCSPSRFIARQKLPQLPSSGSQCVDIVEDASLKLDVPVDNSAIILYRDYAIAASSQARNLHKRLAALYAHIARAKARIDRERRRLRRHIEPCLLLEPDDTVPNVTTPAVSRGNEKALELLAALATASRDEDEGTVERTVKKVAEVAGVEGVKAVIIIAFARRVHGKAVIVREEEDASGDGEKRVGRLLLEKSHGVAPDEVERALPLLPLFGSWRDVLVLGEAFAKTSSKSRGLEACVELFAAQLRADEAADVPSCASKYAPHAGRRAGSKRKRVPDEGMKRFASGVANRLFPGDPTTQAKYRKLRAGLNRELTVRGHLLEPLLCGKQIDKINFRAAPKSALEKYKKCIKKDAAAWKRWQRAMAASAKAVPDIESLDAACGAYVEDIEFEVDRFFFRRVDKAVETLVSGRAKLREKAEALVDVDATTVDFVPMAFGRFDGERPFAAMLAAFLLCKAQGASSACVVNGAAVGVLENTTWDDFVVSVRRDGDQPTIASLSAALDLVGRDDDDDEKKPYDACVLCSDFSACVDATLESMRASRPALRSLLVHRMRAVSDGAPFRPRLALPLPERRADTIVDVAIVMDLTGSMGSWIAQCKEHLANIVWSLARDVDSRVRVAFVGYRDYNDRDRVVVHDFNTQPERIIEAIRSQEASGGGDAPEDVASAWNALEGLAWTGHVRVAVGVWDAPAHGFYTHKGGDDYPGGLCPDQTETLQTIGARVRDKGVDLLSTRIQNGTELMDEMFKDQIYGDKGFGILKLSSGAGKFKEALLSALSTAVLEAIAPSREPGLQTFDGLTLAALANTFNSSLRETVSQAAEAEVAAATAAVEPEKPEENKDDDDDDESTAVVVAPVAAVAAPMEDEIEMPKSTKSDIDKLRQLLKSDGLAPVRLALGFDVEDQLLASAAAKSLVKAGLRCDDLRRLNYPAAFCEALVRAKADLAVAL